MQRGGGRFLRPPLPSRRLRPWRVVVPQPGPQFTRRMAMASPLSASLRHFDLAVTAVCTAKFPSESSTVHPLHYTPSASVCKVPSPCDSPLRSENCRRRRSKAGLTEQGRGSGIEIYFQQSDDPPASDGSLVISRVAAFDTVIKAINHAVDAARPDASRAPIRSLLDPRREAPLSRRNRRNYGRETRG